MKRPLRLSNSGLSRYNTWRDAHTTRPEDIPLVREVLLTIAQNGWPPNDDSEPPAPRWPYQPDYSEPCQWIIARTEQLWVAIRIEADSFDFVTAIHPTPDQEEEQTDWLTDPSEPDS